jgi:iron-regulated transporter 1
MNKICIHKDWVIVVADRDSNTQSRLNANMRRIDLICSIVAPLAVGVLSTVSNAAAASLAISLWSFISLFIEFYLNGWVYTNIPALHHKPNTGSDDNPASASSNPHIMSTAAIFRAYYHHPVFLASFAYCLLYISCLSFGGIMVSYLKTLGLTDAWLAAGRGIAAIVGVLATFTAPVLIKSKGLLWSGSVFLWLQTFCLTPLVFCFVFLDDRSLLFMILIFICICSSRFGLWGADLAIMQIMQEGVDPSQAGQINSAQEALTNVGYLFSFVLTMIFSDPASFLWPTLISYASVLLASVFFRRYSQKQHLQPQSETPVEADSIIHDGEANPIPAKAKAEEL